jgi:hypothetical protein
MTIPAADADVDRRRLGQPLPRFDTASTQIPVVSVIAVQKKRLQVAIGPSRGGDP